MKWTLKGNGFGFTVFINSVMFQGIGTRSYGLFELSMDADGTQFREYDAMFATKNPLFRDMERAYREVGDMLAMSDGLERISRENSFMQKTEREIVKGGDVEKGKSRESEAKSRPEL
ncbi:hypothetical protein L218DRAFT_941903 [Marasmius fiardii PR-910]|nr:hypothetical protein L218DRAFT_941903 [Marasmius fiardii PR-910]